MKSVKNRLIERPRRAIAGKDHLGLDLHLKKRETITVKRSNMERDSYIWTGCLGTVPRSAVRRKLTAKGRFDSVPIMAVL